jgi:hypothetical protein
MMQGLGNISSETLSEARTLMIEHFLNSNPLSASHLTSLFISAIEMDNDYVHKLDNHSRRYYLENLTAKMECLDLIPRKDDMSDGNGIISVEYPNFVGQLPLLTEKILKRKELVSCMLSCGNVLDSFVNSCQELSPPISSG